MTAQTVHGMDVVRTVYVFEGGIHFRNIQLAVGDGRVTVCARVAGII
jgi:hypothetical protein